MRLRINGETAIDGQIYSFTVLTGDTAGDVAQKIADACNRVVGCPLAGSISGSEAVLTAGWKGATGNEIIVEVDTNGDTAGLTFAITTTDGAGIGDTAPVLQKIGNVWTTAIVNGLNADSNTLDTLQEWVGNIESKTGRYSPNVWKPAHVFTGTRAKLKADIDTIVNGRGSEMAHVICPAPGSSALSCEIAADYAATYVPVAASTPQLDVKGARLTVSVPADSDIGDFADEEKRDLLVKIGCSTVELINGRYEILDLVTTRNIPSLPQTSMDYRWVRDQTIRFNCKYLHKIFSDIYVDGKIIVSDSLDNPPANSISPKEWKSILAGKYAPFLINNGLLVSVNEITAGIGTGNPNRFDDKFTVVLTGISRVRSTSITTKFNF